MASLLSLVEQGEIDLRDAAEAPSLVLLNASPDAVLGADGTRRNRMYDLFGKRALDLLIVVGLAPLWLPIYMLVALVVLVVEGRPIHYTSQRTGRECRPYAIIKFRTMRKDADEVLAEVLRSDPKLAEEYRVCNKLKEDPRISRLGALLRKASLDELPQLWNVLKGDMSLVGPRPPSTLADTSNYYGPLAPHVFQDRPGLTGLWQVTERHVTTYERKVWLDLVYASNCNPVTDVVLLAKTVPTVLLGRGAF